MQSNSKMRSDLEPTVNSADVTNLCYMQNFYNFLIKASAKSININIGRLRYLFGPNYGSSNIYTIRETIIWVKYVGTFLLEMPQPTYALPFRVDKSLMFP